MTQDNKLIDRVTDTEQLRSYVRIDLELLQDMAAEHGAPLAVFFVMATLAGDFEQPGLPIAVSVRDEKSGTSYVRAGDDVEFGKQVPDLADLLGGVAETVKTKGVPLDADNDWPFSR